MDAPERLVAFWRVVKRGFTVQTFEPSLNLSLPFLQKRIILAGQNETNKNVDHTQSDICIHPRSNAEVERIFSHGKTFMILASACQILSP